MHYGDDMKQFVIFDFSIIICESFGLPVGNYYINFLFPSDYINVISWYNNYITYKVHICGVEVNS